MAARVVELCPKYSYGILQDLHEPSLQLIFTAKDVKGVVRLRDIVNYSVCLIFSEVEGKLLRRVATDVITSPPLPLDSSMEFEFMEQYLLEDDLLMLHDCGKKRNVEVEDDESLKRAPLEDSQPTCGKKRKLESDDTNDTPCERAKLEQLFYIDYSSMEFQFMEQYLLEDDLLMLHDCGKKRKLESDDTNDTPCKRAKLEDSQLKN